MTTTTDHGFYTGDTLYYKAGVTLDVSTTPDGLTFETPIDSRFNNIDDGTLIVSESIPNIDFQKEVTDISNA